VVVVVVVVEVDVVVVALVVDVDAGSDVVVVVLTVGTGAVSVAVVGGATSAVLGADVSGSPEQATTTIDAATQPLARAHRVAIRPEHTKRRNRGSRTAVLLTNIFVNAMLTWCAMFR